MRFRRHLCVSRAGQSLSLTALTILFLTLAVMFTFSVGQRVREKIKLQALADASAYSLAVAEARAFNYYAWSNRAIVSHYVAMLSVSSYDGYLSFYQDLLSRVGANYLQIEYQLYDECHQYPPCACSAAACTAQGRVRQIAYLYFSQLNPEVDQWAYNRQYLGAEAFMLEFQDKHSAAVTGDPNVMWCNQLLAGIKDHYGNRVPAIRYQQLDVETQLLWYLSGTPQQRPAVPQLETFSLNEDTPDPLFGNSVHGRNGYYGDSSNTPLKYRYGMPDQLAGLTDSKVRTPERDQNLGLAYNWPSSGNLSMYAWPQAGTASDVMFHYYSSAVNNYPHPHEDYDEILFGSRYGDRNGTQQQKDWITRRGFIPNQPHWNWFLNRAKSIAGNQYTTTDVTELGNSKAVGNPEGGATDPGDPTKGGHVVFSSAAPYNPLPAMVPYNYFVPSDPYAGGGKAKVPAGPMEIGGPSYTFAAAIVDGDNNVVPPSGVALANQVHSTTFGTSFALASEDHGTVNTTYDIGPCSDSKCIYPSGHFFVSHPVLVGRDAVYGDPGQSGAGHTHGMHIWSGVPYHEGGHSFSGAANFINYPNDVDEFCDDPNKMCGLYQGHMQYQYSTDANHLYNQPRTVTMLYKPSRAATAQPWDFDFHVGLMGDLSFTTRKSVGDDQSISTATGEAMLGAMAAGLVYYHRPEGGRGNHDDWKESPNLWNPYWRAKLHPIHEDDALSVLKHDLIKGDGDVAQGIISAGHHPFNY